MRIDEQGNIEIESELDYDEGLTNDYGFTSNPKQVIFTKDLMHCVGLGFIDEINDIRKRGLIHVLYNKEFTRNEDRKIILPKDIARAKEQRLDEFLIKFKENNESKKVFNNPKAIMVYIRNVYSEKIKGYENPMANYIISWLEKKNINLYGSEASGYKKLPSILDLDDDPKEIHHKEFAIWHDRIAIGLYNKLGTLLNPKNYELLINTNF